MVICKLSIVTACCALLPVSPPACPASVLPFVKTEFGTHLIDCCLINALHLHVGVVCGALCGTNIARILLGRYPVFLWPACVRRTAPWQLCQLSLDRYYMGCICLWELCEVYCTLAILPTVLDSCPASFYGNYVRCTAPQQSCQLPLDRCPVSSCETSVKWLTFHMMYTLMALLRTSINQLCMIYALYLLVRTVLSLRSVFNWYCDTSLKCPVNDLTI